MLSSFNTMEFLPHNRMLLDRDVLVSSLWYAAVRYALQHQSPLHCCLALSLHARANEKYAAIGSQAERAVLHITK